MARTVFKSALAGFRADTDTNPDHFSIYFDENDAASEQNILIKERQRGSVTIAGFGTATINHGLGYVPLAYVFGQVSGDTWAFIMGEASDITAYFDVDSNNLVLHNTGSVSKQFKYYIFYDRLVSPGLITKSLRYRIVGQANDPGVIKIVKKGLNALQTDNPNDFIFHTNFNTFKILLTDTLDCTVAVSGFVQEFSVLHNQEARPFIMAFLKEDTMGEGIFQNNKSSNPLAHLYFESVRVDYTKIYFRISNSDSSPHTAHVRYYILEAPI